MKPPRRETWCDMWKYTFCPTFTCRSFISALIIVQIFVFIAELVHSMMSEIGLSPVMFLGINAYTLEKFGMRMPERI